MRRGGGEDQVRGGGGMRPSRHMQTLERAVNQQRTALQSGVPNVGYYTTVGR